VGQSAAYALVVLAEDLRPKLGDAAVRAKVQQELGDLLRDVNQAVADYEQLRMIVVAPQAWTIENGMLTPTMKIRRSRIEAEFEAQLAHWYTSQGPVHWA
jgi:long-subunit acyl-CoA synthetase (AMP-forming)